MSSFTVKPKEITKICTRVDIVELKIDLFKSANITVYLKTEDNKIIEQRNIEMSKEDYNKWDADDAFIQQYLIDQLNLEA